MSTTAPPRDRIGVSDPHALREFQLAFANEDACARYLAACRWPDGFRCPRCGHNRAYALAILRWQCAAPSCRYQTSLTSGTVLHRSKSPLTTWFWAAYLMTTDKRGVSALLLQHQLGVSYKTAWLLLHKLRRAMVVPEREKLRGVVEMDETWVGGLQAGLKGSRQLKGRKAALVIVAVERRGTATGRARMEVIPDFTQKTMTDFAGRNIELGTTVITDKMAGFDGLTTAGYIHQPAKQGNIRHGADHVVPLADRAMGNMKQWLLGTFHGVSRAQLQAYLDEFVFRHNRRGNPQAAFQTLLGLGTDRAPSPLAVVRGATDMPHYPALPTS
jgi:transposase-like protein